jgi:hypothetical protein
MATVHQTWDPAGITSLLTTELDALGAGAKSALGTEYDNATNLFLYGLFQLTVTYGTAPTADTTVDIYLVPAPDGTNYGDGSTTVLAQNFAIGGFNMRNVNTLQRLAFYAVPLPPCKFKLQAFNNTNQAFPASGSTVKMIPYGLQAN